MIIYVNSRPCKEVNIFRKGSTNNLIMKDTDKEVRTINRILKDASVININMGVGAFVIVEYSLKDYTYSIALPIEEISYMDYY